MSGYDLYQVDAFTGRLFRGNPAAVMPLSEWLDDATLQAIAMENNLSETAFFVPVPDDPDHDFHLRWFTPAIEVDICGHATLASGHVLFDCLGWHGDTIRFKTRSGRLTVSRDGTRLALNFPALAHAEASVPDGLEAALGQKVLAYFTSAKNMALLADEAAVRAVRPDFGYIAGMGGVGLIVTAPGEEADCASRFFAPAAGIDEDPVTGSAHCVIVPFWAGRLGKLDIEARQVSARGGALHCQLDGARVIIAGEAVLYMTGRVHL